jgi:hypothetical protein
VIFYLGRGSLAWQRQDVRSGWRPPFAAPTGDAAGGGMHRLALCMP